MTIYMDTYDYFMRNGVKIYDGQEYLLIEHSNVNTGDKWYTLDISEHAYPGNVDPSIKRYHGWRGTTNDIAVYAHGVRKVLKQTAFQNGRSRIVLSKDLHPDWE